jgi:hypothetical protein
VDSAKRFSNSPSIIVKDDVTESLCGQKMPTRSGAISPKKTVKIKQAAEPLSKKIREGKRS